jgi:hypothetical protein
VLLSCTLRGDGHSRTETCRNARIYIVTLQCANTEHMVALCLTVLYYIVLFAKTGLYLQR